MKSLLVVALVVGLWGFNAEAKSAKKAETKPVAACTKAEDHAGHKHNDTCGCPKVETSHGHAHYEHTDAKGKVHHHVEHDGHYDECDKPHA